MNIKEILAPDEEILFTAQESRLMPGGKEVTPNKTIITNQRLILETTEMLGLKHQYDDLHYSDIEAIQLKKNILSSDVMIQSRFKGQILLKSLSHKNAEHVERILSEGINRYRYGYGGVQQGGQQR